MSRLACRSQSGFAYIAAVVLLVVVAGLSVALLHLTTTQQSTINQGLLGAQASLAARGGIEWALHEMSTRCPAVTAGSATIELNDFKAQSGFDVTVTCSYQRFNEGQRIPMPPDGGADQPNVVSYGKRLYQIKAVACNGSSGKCPDDNSVARAEYVERARMVTACLTENADGTVDKECDA